jgi:hypothetical protein
MMKMLKLLPLLLILAGCSYLVKRIDDPITNEKAYRKKIPVVASYCPLETDSPFQLVGTNAHAQQSYRALMSDPAIKKLDQLDHFAIWSLLQFSIRPDQSSPTARLQVLLGKNGSSRYFDFFSEETVDQFPYLYGVEWILKKMGKTTRLETYASIIEKHLKKNLKVGKNFEDFLLLNIETLKSDPELIAHFMRGTEVLKEDESIPDLDFVKLLRYYRSVEKKQKIMVNSSLNAFTNENGSKGSCNYDFNLYNNSIFLIDNIIPDANMFGLIDRDFSFMASSSQRFDKISSLLNLPLFKGISRIRSSAVCVIESDEGKIWTFSNKSRDPGQHLFQLMRYGLARSQSVKDVDRLIRHSRYLFLYDPTRLVIESGRSRNAQIENLLKLNIPIYNAEKLGNIWAFTTFQSKSRFIIDDRNLGAFQCE